MKDRLSVYIIYNDPKVIRKPDRQWQEEIDNADKIIIIIKSEDFEFTQYAKDRYDYAMRQRKEVLIYNNENDRFNRIR